MTAFGGGGTSGSGVPLRKEGAGQERLVVRGIRKRLAPCPTPRAPGTMGGLAKQGLIESANLLALSGSDAEMMVQGKTSRASDYTELTIHFEPVDKAAVRPNQIDRHSARAEISEVADAHGAQSVPGQSALQEPPCP
jgi:hypothetical protein